MTDEQLQSMIGIVLRTGVLAAALIVGASGVFYLVGHHADPPRYARFQRESADLRTIGGILHSAVQLHSEAMIQLGLLLLIATPIARVALAVLGFYREGDRLYTVVSLIVLAILIFSLGHSS
jgi:uncharacterized membrane protein